MDPKKTVDDCAQGFTSERWYRGAMRQIKEEGADWPTQRIA